MRFKCKRSFFFVCIGVNLLVSCAGARLSTFGNIEDVPSDVPKELQDKFQISDQAPKQLEKPPEPVAPKTTKKTKTKKKKNEPVVVEQTPIEPVSTAVPTTPNRRPKEERIFVGEKIALQLTYFGVLAGDLNLEVLPFKFLSDRKVYHLKANAKSSSMFSMFYRVDDWIESFYDFEGWYSHRFNLVLDETKQTRNVVELYDSEKKQAFYWLRWNHHQKGKIEKREYYPMTPFPQDTLSAFYYLRQVDFSKVGEKVTFPIVSEGKTWDAEITLEKRQVLDTLLGEVNTVKLRVETRLQGVLQKSGDTFLWLTDDIYRYPVRLEAKVKIGALVLSVKSIQPGEGAASFQPIR